MCVCVCVCVCLFVCVVGDDPFLAASPHSHTHAREGRPDQVPHPEQGQCEFSRLSASESAHVQVLIAKKYHFGIQVRFLER